MESKEERRVIPVKNYFILSIICLVTIVATIYINAWIKTYKVNSNVNPLIGKVQEITLSDLEATMSETNLAILYVANNDNFALDKEILKRVNADSINDYFYYMNVNTISQEDCIKSLKEYFSDVKNEINSVPMLIYIKDGQAVKVIDSKDKKLNINDFNVILDNYLEID